MAKKDNSKMSPSQPDEREIRPVSKWRRIECENFANDNGLTLKSKKVIEMRVELETLKKRGVIKFPNENTHGGSRENAGQKPNEERERLNTLKEQAELHALEEVEVSVATKQGLKMVKKQRAHALLDVLFTEGLKRKNIQAIREYFDRTRGRARQEIDMSGEIATKDQYTPEDPALQEAQKAYAEAIKRQIVNGNYEE